MQGPLVAAVLVLGTAFPAMAQTPEETVAPPTKLEAMLVQQGAVIVRGLSRIGEIRGRESSGVAIDALEATNVTTGDKVSGLALTVKGTGASPSERTSYLDRDEIDAFLRGLDTLARVDRSTTQLADFLAVYRTRDGLEISTYSVGALVKAAAASGHRNRVTALLQWSDLAKLRDLVVQAKTALDSLRP